MSEAITKACETCAGVGRPMTFGNGVVDCVDCSSTGRVPDEVATLRSQLDAARAEVARLTAEVERLKTATEAQSRGRRVQAAHEREVAALYGTIDAARAEVARLTAREREAARILSFASTSHASAWSAEANRWLAGCKS